MNTDFDFMKVAESDKAFAREFENFVNGKMQSADKTGRAMTCAHRYLQQQMFKVFVGFMRQLAINYKSGRYDDRNEWASRLSAEAYDRLIDSEFLYDPDYVETGHKYGGL